MKEKIQNIIRVSITYTKSLKWSILLGIAIFSVVLAIINNIRVDNDKSVEWIGSQDIMEKPADIL